MMKPPRLAALDLCGVKGAKAFSDTFRIVFQILFRFFAFFKPFFVSISGFFFGGGGQIRSADVPP